MKIAIIGTRGIPNNYGGFEQLAEYLSLGLIKRGHQVYVYSSHKHVYQENEWKGVNIIHRSDPEEKIGTAGQFIYDLNCILDSRKRNFDVILNLGYTSSSIWMSLFPKKSKVVTNMDGLEWKRTKYSKKVQRFLKFAEGLAARKSDALIADSTAIQEYLSKTYGLKSDFIAYGALPFDSPDKNFLTEHKLEAYNYNILIARMEPENNIEVILDGIHESKSPLPFLVIGNPTNKFGAYLREKYKNDPRIQFKGQIYDSTIINNLRFFSKSYFHGHSVGGTNPSLLEAMACHCLIAAHDNEFNRAVLQSDAFYFRTSSDIANFVESFNREEQTNKDKIQNNYSKIINEYSWEKITDQYENALKK